MIVGRVEAFEMDDLGPPVRIGQREVDRLFADAVAIERGPAIRACHHLDPLGPQRVEIDRIARRIFHHLEIGIAVQEQLRGDRLQQGLRAAGAGDEAFERGRIAGQRRAADPLRHDPDAALRHRIGEIGLADGGGVIEAGAGWGSVEGCRPRGDEAARNRHANIAPALEGGDESGEEGHGGLRGGGLFGWSCAWSWRRE